MFEKAWSDAEALLESAAMFPGLPAKDRKIVCHVCYLQIMAHEERQPDGPFWLKRRRDKAS